MAEVKQTQVIRMGWVPNGLLREGSARLHSRRLPSWWPDSRYCEQGEAHIHSGFGKIACGNKLKFFAIISNFFFTGTVPEAKTEKHESDIIYKLNI